MGHVGFKFITMIIAFVLVVIFAVQNATVAALKFLFWEFNVSLAVIIIGAVAVGAFIGFFVFLIVYLKKGKTIKAEKKAEKKIEKKAQEIAPIAPITPATPAVEETVETVEQNLDKEA